MTVDNGKPGYNETGVGWQTLNQGWNGTSRLHASDGGTSAATWTFTQKHGLPAGSYEAFVTYVPGASRDSTTTYQVFDGTFLRGTVNVDQTGTPTDGFYQASAWKSLGVFSIIHGRMIIRVNVETDGSVDSDGALIVTTGSGKGPVQISIGAMGTVPANESGVVVVGLLGPTIGGGPAPQRVITATIPWAPDQPTDARSSVSPVALPSLTETVINRESVVAAMDTLFGSEFGLLPDEVSSALPWSPGSA
jgi:hypothetical protein